MAAGGGHCVEVRLALLAYEIEQSLKADSRDTDCSDPVVGQLNDDVEHSQAAGTPALVDPRGDRLGDPLHDSLFPQGSELQLEESVIEWSVPVEETDSTPQPPVIEDQQHYDPSRQTDEDQSNHEMPRTDTKSELQSVFVESSEQTKRQKPATSQTH